MAVQQLDSARTLAQIRAQLRTKLSEGSLLERVQRVAGARDRHEVLFFGELREQQARLTAASRAHGFGESWLLKLEEREHGGCKVLVRRVISVRVRLLGLAAAGFALAALATRLKAGAAADSTGLVAFASISALNFLWASYRARALREPVQRLLEQLLGTSVRL